jgi:dTDP-4-dehydrorhamnose reductase
MSRVLVTGASGMLGTSLVPVLASSGYEVVRHGRSGAADVNCDLSKCTETSEMLDAVRPDIILNLVALTNVDQCEEQVQLAYLVNVRSVENLAAWQNHPDNKQCRLVHISTDQVYDGAGPHAEDDVVITNTYALTKYAAEIAASKSAATILRTNFFGQSRLDGRKSFSDWLLDSLVSQNSIKTFTDVLFSPLSIQTLGEMILRVLARPVEGVYNLGSREGMSKSDFAFMLADIFGLDNSCMTRALSSEVNFSAYRPLDMRMDSTRFETAYDIELPTLASEIRKLRNDYE